MMHFIPHPTAEVVPLDDMSGVDIAAAIDLLKIIRRCGVLWVDAKDSRFGALLILSRAGSIDLYANDNCSMAAATVRHREKQPDPTSPGHGS